jgi:hypothetical protein
MATDGWDDTGLSNREYLIYALCFAVLPAVNVLVSSFLYYYWRKTNPRRAEQINRLGWRILVLHIGLYVLSSLSKE